MNYRHILHIDDDEDDQEIFALALERIGTEITYTPVTSALDALASLKAGAVKPDVIFLDLNMPRMDGRQFLAELKDIDHLSGITVIVLSTASYPKAREEMVNLGAHDFQSKPPDFSELVALLTSILKA